MYTPLFHPPLGLQAPQTPTAEQETAQQHPEGAAAPRRSPTCAQQMAVVPGLGSQVCEYPHTRRKLPSAPETPHGSGGQGREAQRWEYTLIIENVVLAP